MAKEKHNEQNAAEIISSGEKFFEKHANLLTYIVLGIVIIAFGIWAYIQYVHKPRIQEGYAAIFSTEERFIQGQDSTILQATGINDEGILKEIKEYSGTKASKLGNLYAGIAYYDLGKYQEAITHLEKYKSEDNMVAPSVVRLMGDCYVQLKQYDKAVEQFEKAASLADNDVISPGCLLKAARVYEFQKKYKKALESYQTIKEKYYTSPEAGTVDAEIIRVKSLIR